MKLDGVRATETDLAKWEAQVRKGTLGLAVLAALWQGELYGLEILQTLERIAGFTVQEGTIYPLLHRLKVAGFVDSRWVESGSVHPRKYYQLTASGRRYGCDVASEWTAFAAGMNRLLAPMEEKIRVRRRAF